MKPRINLGTASPDAYQAMLNLEQASQALALDTTIRELIKLRTSQINGCAFCIDMHARDLREHGESEHRIWALNAWRETTFFDSRERAALALAEEMARLSGGHGVSDATYNEAAAVFTPDELVAVLWTATVINAWNRIAVSTRRPPAGREPRLRAATSA